jgi:uroporphyrinogen decarboxylase
MNGYQRIHAAFHGEQPDTVPIMLHNFMMAAREAGMTMQEFRTNPESISRAFLRSVETYNFDGVLLDIDTVTLAGATGVPVDYPLDEPARTSGPLLRRLEDVDELAPVDIRTFAGVQVWLEAARILHRQLGNEVYLRGNCDQCPFSLAAMIRGIDAWMMDLLDPDREERLHKLLEFACTITDQFIRHMAETGVHMVSNGDSTAGPDLVSPALYRRFALPYERRIVDAAHRLRLPYVLHICGNTNTILPDMLATGADGLELDYKTDSRLVRYTLADRAVFVGNIDPSGVLARGTPAQVAIATRELLGIFAGRPGFVLNAGCAIPPITPHENLAAMIHTARTFGIS